jgi:uncharacterized protein YegP (UPF0339 family)
VRIELVTKRGWFRTSWFWRIKGRNGETLASSETYSSHAKARHTAELVAAVPFSGLPILEVTK